MWPLLWRLLDDQLWWVTSFIFGVLCSQARMAMQSVRFEGKLLQISFYEHRRRRILDICSQIRDMTVAQHCFWNFNLNTSLLKWYLYNISGSSNISCHNPWVVSKKECQTAKCWKIDEVLYLAFCHFYNSKVACMIQIMFTLFFSQILLNLMTL